jgi:hypothetical protein
LFHFPDITLDKKCLRHPITYLVAAFYIYVICYFVYVIACTDYFEALGMALVILPVSALYMGIQCAFINKKIASLSTSSFGAMILMIAMIAGG